MKRSILFLELILACLFAQAQTATLHGFAIGSSMAENGNATFAVIGETFTGKTVESGHELTLGLAQAQLERELVEVTVDHGEGYSGHGFSYPATTPVGNYSDSRYDLHGGSFRYDLLTTLKLKVLEAIACGELVYDGDHNPYPTVAVAGYCWTQENLRATHYADGITEIEKALVYHSAFHPDEADNENTYGRLYTWYSAVGAPEDGSAMPAPDGDGYVQGICPDGWHIPTETEMSALRSLSAEDLRSTELWVAPNGNTNSTGFRELPAGRYNTGLGRFEGMGSNAGLWSAEPAGPASATALSFDYYCNTPLSSPANSTDGLSVRCVKNS